MPKEAGATFGATHANNGSMELEIHASLIVESCRLLIGADGLEAGRAAVRRETRRAEPIPTRFPFAPGSTARLVGSFLAAAPATRRGPLTASRPAGAVPPVKKSRTASSMISWRDFPVRATSPSRKRSICSPNWRRPKMRSSSTAVMFLPVTSLSRTSSRSAAGRNVKFLKGAFSSFLVAFN